MKKALAFTALLALCACSETPSDDTATSEVAVTGEAEMVGGDAGFEAVAPGNYTVAHEDGSVDNLLISPGMTWSMVFANGDAAGGTIFAQGGNNCFVTEGVEGHQCFIGSEPAEDGSMQVTADDGEVMTVSPAEEPA